MTERGDGVNPNESPLDMASNLEWYRKNKDDLLSLFPKQTQLADMPTIPLKNLEHFYMTPSETQALIMLFPKSAQDRSYIDFVEGDVRFYFHKDSTPENILPTINVQDAISPTAFVPGYTQTRRRSETGEVYGVVKLFEIPTDDDRDLKKLVQAQAFVHEYAHTIIHPIKFVDSYLLRLPGGEVIEGSLLLEGFRLLMENSTPFSFYSKSGREAAKNDEGKAFTAVDEELSEAISAYLLGYIFSEEVDRRMDPFVDRPAIKEYIRNFLLAEKVEDDGFKHDVLIDVLGEDEGEDELPIIINTDRGDLIYSYEEILALGNKDYKRGAERIFMAVTLRSALPSKDGRFRRPLQDELDEIYAPPPVNYN